jgi:glyoxylase-like metal-dependent hydrolase (beta-lactamase superfamily II)
MIVVLGKFRIDVIETGLFSLDGGAMFGIIPKAIWSKAYDSGDELNRIPLADRLLLVRWDNRVMLVDTGNGTKLDEKIVKRFNIDIQKSSVEKSLRKFDLKADSITDVLLTHLHFDHSGGATNLINGEIVPAFPNARYYVQKRQYDWAVRPTEKDRASYFPENYVPLKEAGLLDLIDGDGDIFPGISLITVNGHTLGMQLVKISDTGKSLLFCADLCATSAHLPIPFGMAYDNQPLITIEEKKKILPRVYEEGTILVFEHDAFIQAAKIKISDKGFQVDKVINITSDK